MLIDVEDFKSRLAQGERAAESMAAEPQASARERGCSEGEDTPKLHVHR